MVKARLVLVLEMHPQPYSAKFAKDLVESVGVAANAEDDRLVLTDDDAVG